MVPSAFAADHEPPPGFTALFAGKSLEDTKKSVDLSKYKDWGGYEQMHQLNIEGAYRLIQATRRPNQ